MSATPPPPRLDSVVEAFNAAGARFVVIGGFAVIAHRYVRATVDSDLLIPNDVANDERITHALSELGASRASDRAPLQPELLRGAEHLRVLSDAGLVDLLREGVPPLDFETVAAGALTADYGTGAFLIAGLGSLVAFKRLAGRPQDQRDLEALAEIHGELPVQPVPGLDD
jgi:hypothetical protein